MATPRTSPTCAGSLLPEVLRRRRGLPILLSVVWLEVARRAEVDAFGTSLPGHYVVGLGDPDGDHTVVDPFRGGRPVTLTAPPARWTEVPTLLRILTNVRSWAGSPERVRTALWATELALLLPGHPADLRAEHGRLLARVGDYQRRRRRARRLRRRRRDPRPGDGGDRTAGSPDGPRPPQLTSRELAERDVRYSETICPMPRTCGYGARMAWDAQGYDRQFSFVTDLGAPLLDLLAAQPGERVLDLGCGTGHQAAELSAVGAEVVGLDADAAMIARAQDEHPGTTYVLGDAQQLDRRGSAGRRPSTPSSPTPRCTGCPTSRRSSTASVGLLRPGGRFVSEQGGAGNIARVWAALQAASDRPRAPRAGPAVDVPDARRAGGPA